MIQQQPRSPLPRFLTAIGAAFGVAGLVALLGEYGHRQITHAYRNDFRDDPARPTLREPVLDEGSGE